VVRNCRRRIIRPRYRPLSRPKWYVTAADESSGIVTGQRLVVLSYEHIYSVSLTAGKAYSIKVTPSSCYNRVVCS